MIHRDVKPDNVLLTTAGTVKVCDFGIAGLRDARPDGATQATAVGTSQYMAPEQAAGGSVDERSDLYALGCVLYAMLTGAPPFPGSDDHRVRWQQVHEPPAPVGSLRPEVPAELAGLVDRLLAKDPADRPARRRRGTRRAGRPARRGGAGHRRRGAAPAGPRAGPGHHPHPDHAGGGGRCASRPRRARASGSAWPVSPGSPSGPPRSRRSWSPW